MTMAGSEVAEVFGDEWSKLVAVLMKDLGDLDLAEESAQDAFVEAAKRWPETGMPDRPGAWLLTVARRRAIDQLRRDQRFVDRLPALASRIEEPPPEPAALGDDQLALIFGCCHDSLGVDAQVALTLRQVCGLTTAQIASAFLVEEPTLGKRLVRAKAKIRSAGVPFTVPPPERLSQRLGAVLHCIYLIFNEGYASANSPELVRGDLCDEAYWLVDLVARLVPDNPEVLGLQALIRFIDARRPARFAVDGSAVLLQDQDRTLWNHAMIAEADMLLRRALNMGQAGPLQIQAAIAGVHDAATVYDETDWQEILGLYTVLRMLLPGPVIELNRAVAVSMVDGPEAALDLLDDLAEQLAEYRYFHATRADLLRRLERGAEAATAYRLAISLTTNREESQFLRRRLGEVDTEQRY